MYSYHLQNIIFIRKNDTEMTIVEKVQYFIETIYCSFKFKL